MCTRFSNTLSLETVEAFFAAMADILLPPPSPRADFTLGQDIAVIPAASQRRVTSRPWGWKKSDGGLLANARSETAAAKPLFAPHADTRRCVVPSDGFFEFKHATRCTTPWFFKLKSTPVFGLAGLMNAAGRVVILTTKPNARVRAVHSRMPVILTPDVLSGWLDSKVPFRSLSDRLFAPWPAEDMEAHSPEHANLLQQELF